jgi:hypothetical protein
VAGSARQDVETVVGEGDYQMRNERAGMLWTAAEVEILRKHYPLRDWQVLLFLLRGRSQESIVGKASKLGISGGSNNRMQYVSGDAEETCSKPDAPQRYSAPYEPLKPPVEPYRRPGSDDWRTLPSVNK